jgi:hypothetical protein
MEDNPENQKPYKSQTSEARSRGINNINGTSSKFAGILMSTKTNCNPPRKSEQLLVENSAKLKQRSFLCVNHDTQIVRSWRY